MLKVCVRIVNFGLKKKKRKWDWNKDGADDMRQWTIIKRGKKMYVDENLTGHKYLL